MKKVLVTLVAVIVVFFSITTVAAQPAYPNSDPVASSESNDVESANLPTYGMIREHDRIAPGAPPVPVPVRPPVTITAATETFEFVGVSRDFVAGNRGVLNYTLTCQAAFPGSRMCSVNELLQTRNVPRQLGDVTAWIQPTQSALTASNCEGWTTLSTQKAGLAIAIDATCYAGLVERTCDSALAVACCAPMPRE